MPGSRPTDSGTHGPFLTTLRALIYETQNNISYSSLARVIRYGARRFRLQLRHYRPHRPQTNPALDTFDYHACGRFRSYNCHKAPGSRQRPLDQRPDHECWPLSDSGGCYPSVSGLFIRRSPRSCGWNSASGSRRPASYCRCCGVLMAPATSQAVPSVTRFLSLD